ncbi:MAG: tripartite tricarboxylate transporter substrate binding protein, partial [Burkholderiales bacterium]
MKTDITRYALGLALAFVAGTALAQVDYPSKPLRIIVGNTPGSTVDLVARKLGEALGTNWGQPVVIVNQPGAGGLLGSQTIAQAQKDGHTLGFYGNT